MFKERMEYGERLEVQRAPIYGGMDLRRQPRDIFGTNFKLTDSLAFEDFQGRI